MGLDIDELRGRVADLCLMVEGLRDTVRVTPAETAVYHLDEARKSLHMAWGELCVAPERKEP